MSATIATKAPHTASRPARLLAYAQLVRIPNVFTAIADVTMAAIALGALPGQLVSWVFLVLASSCFYCAGMVWNDYFDYEVDLRERPERPLPSHRLTRHDAARLGMALIGLGIVFAIISGFRADGFHFGPLLIASALAAAILLYDSWLKRTFLGPVVMGLCRFFNVLLGFTIAANGIPSWGFVPAIVVGVYITGVTWFARREARISRKLDLGAATLVMLAALALALLLPVTSPLAQSLDEPDVSDGVTSLHIGRFVYPYLLVAYGFWIGIPASIAIRNPAPRNVQRTVKRAILGLIVLDAILATAIVGLAGLWLLLLLPPALIAGRWVYST